MTNQKQTVKFGDICREVKLSTKDPLADGYDKYIGLEHLDSGSLKIKRWGIISDDNPSFTRVFKKGHILFGKRRCYLKKAAIAEFDGICSGDIIVMEPQGDLMLPELLPFIVQSEKFWDWAIKTSSGSLSPRTKFSSLVEFSLLLPDIVTQEKMLKPLLKAQDSLDVAEDALYSGVKLKMAFSESLLNGDMRLPGFTHKWKIVKLKEIGKLISGLTYSPSDVTQNNNALLVLRSSNIQDGSLSFEDNVFVNIDVNKDQLSRENDILICVRNGSKSLIGKSALITKECPKATNGAFMSVFRTDDYRYVFHLFQSTAYRKQVLKNLGATINSINSKDLENFKFKMPEKNEREAISEFLEKLDNTISRLVISRNEIFQLKKSLLSKITMQPAL